jgi:phenylpyruvate tautomerase PptA (4-oxalocrotonate tautomerase family)
MSVQPSNGKRWETEPRRENQANPSNRVKRKSVMPTYVCSIPPGKLNDSQKSEIAGCISNRHSEATGAPQSMVQVVIEESRADRYLGFKRTSDHIWVRGDIRAGRTEEARVEMMLNMMKDINKITGIGDDNIWIYLCNLAPTDMVEYGHVLPRPGKEKQWFEQLPQSLQRYLASVGTTAENFTL